MQRVSKQVRNELVEALRGRYEVAAKTEKSRILKEFTAVSGYHRKHAIRLLKVRMPMAARAAIAGRRVYNEALKQALVVLWESADRICGKRLKALIPSLLPAMERHGHMKLEATVREQLLQVSAATIDRLLMPVRRSAGSRRKGNYNCRASLVSGRIKVHHSRVESKCTTLGGGFSKRIWVLVARVKWLWAARAGVVFSRRLLIVPLRGRVWGTVVPQVVALKYLFLLWGGFGLGECTLVRTALESIAASGYGDDFDVVEKSVEDGAGGRDVAKELSPFLDGAVGGHQGGAVFVATHDDLQEDFAALTTVRLDWISQKLRMGERSSCCRTIRRTRGVMQRRKDWIGATRKIQEMSTNHD